MGRASAEACVTVFSLRGSVQDAQPQNYRVAGFEEPSGGNCIYGAWHQCTIKCTFAGITVLNFSKHLGWNITALLPSCRILWMIY